MVKLTCNCCGGKLEIIDDIERFACRHCGTEWLVNRGGGIVSLKSVEDKLEKISSSSEKTAEHSKILADEIKLKAIKEKISILEKDFEEENNKHKKSVSILRDEKNKIILNPQKENETKSQTTFIVNSICVLSFLVFVILLVIAQEPNTGIEPNIINPKYVGISGIVFFVSLFACIIAYVSLNDTVPDKKQKDFNLHMCKKLEEKIQNLTNDKAKEIEKEINDLKNKAKEIKESFLK